MRTIISLALAAASIAPLSAALGFESATGGQSADVLNSSASSEALEELRQGAAAAKTGSWKIAVTHFTHAQQLAPRYPPALFNLAAAHANSGAGHEAAAICWFEAYLLASPSASNAGEVRKNIRSLDATAQDRISRRFRAGLAALDALKDPAMQKNEAANVMAMMATVDELDQALIVGRKYRASEYGQDAHMRDVFRSILAGELIQVGRLDDAVNTLSSLETKPADRSSFLVEDIDHLYDAIAFEYDMVGDYDASRHFLNLRSQKGLDIHLKQLVFDKTPPADRLLESWLMLAAEASADSSLTIEADVQKLGNDISQFTPRKIAGLAAEDKVFFVHIHALQAGVMRYSAIAGRGHPDCTPTQKRAALHVSC